MRADGPTSFLLDPLTGWQTGSRSGVAVDDAIRLAGDAQGPLALSSPDGSLGGLLLPRGMALDEEGVLYLLDVDATRVMRFDIDTQRFVLLPEVGGDGDGVRRFRAPANIAIAGNNLYVADHGNRRVQVFALGSLVLRYVWGAPAAETWDPVDVTTAAGAAYVLDGQNGRVYRHRPGTDDLRLLIQDAAGAGQWSRVAVDRDGRVYLLVAAPAAPVLWIYDATGKRLGEVRDAGDVRDRFEPPALRLDYKKRFCLPRDLTRQCDRRAPTAPPAATDPLALCRAPSGQWPNGWVFDCSGTPARVDPYEGPGPHVYERSGTWISNPLDSQTPNCQWHRIEIRLPALPAGTSVAISTYTDEQPLSIAELQAPPHLSLWAAAYRTTGRVPPPPGRSGSPAPPDEFLVQSRKGRYLRIKVELSSDGYASPAVSAIRVHYPRESYLRSLPAVYAADEESAWFLERFLSLFQTVWDDLEQTINDSARLFDPAAVPAGAFMRYLARWLAQPLEGVWNAEQQRNLLKVIPRLTSRRGTPDGVRGYLQGYLQNLTGIAPEEQQGFPHIVEGFRERQRLLLGMEDFARLGYGAPLWGAGAVGRLQLGVYARADEARLVSTGDPQRDVFHEYAHRFRVFVPSAWVRTAEAERMVRRALDAEAPAHAAYDLCLVEPRFRVGLQSTVGLNTILGAYPVAALSCPHDKEAPPSRPPRNRLGYDTILAQRPTPDAGLPLRAPLRVGVDTTLT